MISGDLVKTLDLLSNEELYDIKYYIDDLTSKRKEETQNKYLNELKNILIKAQEEDIYFRDGNRVLLPNDIYID